MSAEYSYSADQVVASGASVLFNESPVPCREGLIYHRDGSGIFRLVNRFFRQNLNVCQCWKRNSNYLVSFGANMEIPEGGTVETISLALVIDGEVDSSAVMEVTPAAVGEPFNVSVSVIAQVPYICTCSNVSIRNTSTQAITVSNANIVIDKA